MFLSLEDPHAKVQGSRDPLGVQPVWATFGRHVVTNLTTVSNSVRGFTILLLARHYAERLIEERKAGEEEAFSIFLCMEQLGAYARYVVRVENPDVFHREPRSASFDDRRLRAHICTSPRPE